MALFDENVTITPAPKRRLSGTALAGIWALAVALVALLVLTLLPTSYVIERPGPVFNTLGTVPTGDGEDEPLISISGADTFPTTGTLDLLTVQVVGDRERTPSWFELASAWFDPSRAVVPIDEIFPQGQTSDERNEQSAAMMVDSQKEATAAALAELGYDVHPMVSVYALTDDSPAQGILQENDVILEANGTPVTETNALRDVINAGAGAPVELLIERDGVQQTVTVTPQQSVVDGETLWLIGVSTMHDYDFPIDVSIQLNNVGGPSAGMMFALGIIDTLTEDELTGGENIAGTGTIDSAGTVGAIGGIRQKLYGAKDAGADFFLAPKSNCDEVTGHVPDGLQVFAVDTLDDALAALDGIRSDDTSDLPTCTTS